MKRGGGHVKVWSNPRPEKCCSCLTFLLTQHFVTLSYSQTSNSTSELCFIMGWPSQSLDFSLIKILRHDLTQVIHARKASD